MIQAEGMDFRYFCRRLIEDPTTGAVSNAPTEVITGALNADGVFENDYEEDMLVPLSEDRSLVHTDHGGCFGTGVGPLDHNEGRLLLKAEAFYEEEQLYEITVEVRKDVRMSR